MVPLSKQSVHHFKNFNPVSKVYIEKHALATGTVEQPVPDMIAKVY